MLGEKRRTNSEMSFREPVGERSDLEEGFKLSSSFKGDRVKIRRKRYLEVFTGPRAQARHRRMSELMFNGSSRDEAC